MFNKYIEKKVEEVSFWLDKQSFMKQNYKFIFMMLELYILSDFYYRVISFVTFIVLKDQILHPLSLFNFTVSNNLVLAPSVHEILLYVSAIAISFKVKDDNVDIVELKKIKRRKLNLFVFFIVFSITMFLSKLILPGMANSIILQNKFLIYSIVLLVILGFYTFINIFISYVEVENKKHVASWRRWLIVIGLIALSFYTQYNYNSCISGNRYLYYAERPGESYKPCSN